MSPDHLFTLRIPSMRTDRHHTITVEAFDGQHVDSTGHNRIEVRVLFRAKGGKPVEIFPRGFTHCATAAHDTIDGDAAKELVCSLVAMKPGDTDQEFFASYSEDQIAFVEEYSDEISQYAERWKCRSCGRVNGRSRDRWEGKRCEGHGRVGDES